MKYFTVFFLVLCMIFITKGKKVRGQEVTVYKHHHAHNDSSFHGMKGIKVKKFGDDSIVVYIQKENFSNFEFPNCPFFPKKNKYNGHWAGVGLGFNGYVNSDFNMDFGPRYSYMNLNTARSLVVNLNPIELNLNLVKNHFGFTSGLGFQLSNYYFTGNSTLIPDSSSLVAFNVVDVNGAPVEIRRNKLFVSYLTLPILFEYQTNSRHRINSFHIALGVIAGVRICSYTKQVFDSREQTYYLADAKGNKVASFYVDRFYSRNHSAYHLSPFKLDATVRIGWSILNLWATYSITPMFQKNQGPVLYPWTVGIQLIGW